MPGLLAERSGGGFAGSPDVPASALGPRIVYSLHAGYRVECETSGLGQSRRRRNGCPSTKSRPAALPCRAGGNPAVPAGNIGGAGHDHAVGVTPHWTAAVLRVALLHDENTVYGGSGLHWRTVGKHSDTGRAVRCYIGKSVGERYREARSHSRVVVRGRVFRLLPRCLDQRGQEARRAGKGF